MINAKIFDSFYEYGSGFKTEESDKILNSMKIATGPYRLYELSTQLQEDIAELWDIVGYDFRSDPDSYEEFLVAVRIYVFLLTGIVSLNERFNDNICSGIFTREQSVVEVL